MSTGGIIGIVVAVMLAVIAAVVGLFLIKRRRHRKIDGAGQVLFNPVGLDLNEKYYGASGGEGGEGSGGSGHGSAASESVLGGVTAASGVSAMAGGQTAGAAYSDSGYHPEMVSYHPPIEPSFAHYGYDQYDPEYLAQQEQEAAYMQYQQEQLYQQYQEQMAAEHASGEGMVGGPVSYYPSAAQLCYQQQHGEQDYEDYRHLYHLTRDDMAPVTEPATVSASAAISGSPSPHPHTTTVAISSPTAVLANRVSVADSEDSVQNRKNEPRRSPKRGPQVLVPDN
ncbi:hypothetical protein BG005_008060 [Podila minutissima]|nr:hypothetical protein BG005_008060 [Podila minutissima]